MRYTSIEHATVECLADMLLGERLPISIKDGATPVVPANTQVDKAMLKLVYEAHQKNTLDMDPSPLRIRVFETIDRARERFDRQLARETKEAAKADPPLEM